MTFEMLRIMVQEYANQHKEPAQLPAVIDTISVAYQRICQGEDAWTALGDFSNAWYGYGKHIRPDLIREPLPQSDQQTDVTRRLNVQYYICADRATQSAADRSPQQATPTRASFAAESTRPRAYERYEEIVCLRIILFLSHYKLQQLSPQHVQAFYSQKSKEGFSALTMISFHNISAQSIGDSSEMVSGRQKHLPGR
jgi:hypothetical protein